MAAQQGEETREDALKLETQQYLYLAADTVAHPTCVTEWSLLEGNVQSIRN